jgi:2-enoate reductase
VIAGIDRPNVVTAQEVLAGKKEVGPNVAIIGGGMVGCETGHYLAERGKRVVIIEALARIATDMGPMVRRRLLDGLRGNQVAMLTGTTCEEITEEGVIVTTGEGKKESIQADTVILAVGYKKNDDLYKMLEGTVPEVYCLGDSAEPRRIMEAIDDGYRVGTSL